MKKTIASVAGQIEPSTFQTTNATADYWIVMQWIPQYPEGVDF